MLLKMNKSRLSLQTNKIQEHNSNIQFTPKTQTKPYNNIANVLEMIIESINRNPRMIKQLYFAQGPIEEIPSLKDDRKKRGTLLYTPSLGPEYDK